MAKVQKVSFSKIKRGKFFRFPGRKTLWQKGNSACIDAQVVSGRNVGKGRFSIEPNTPVIPVNAKIVEEK